MEHQCALCGTSNKSLLRCSSCKQTFYCSADHQKQHWKSHKQQCKQLASQSPQQPQQQQQQTKQQQQQQQQTKQQILQQQQRKQQLQQQLEEEPLKEGEVPTYLDEKGNRLTDVDAIYRTYDEYIQKNGPPIRYHVSAAHKPKLVPTDIDGLTIINNCLTQFEHDELLQIAEEEKEYAAMNHDGYDHVVTTMQFIPSIDMYVLYRNICNRLIRDKFLTHAPKQLTINYYEPDEGLIAHIDNPEYIKEEIVGFSLASPCVMQFTHTKTGEVKEYVLEPRSAMIQKGDVRYNWKHGIQPTAVQTITVPVTPTDNNNNSNSNNSNSSADSTTTAPTTTAATTPADETKTITIHRSYRVSVQFSDFDPVFFASQYVKENYQVANVKV